MRLPFFAAVKSLTILIALFLGSLASAEVKERSFNEYLQRFPEAAKYILDGQKPPILPAGLKGNQMLGELQAHIFDKQELPVLKDGDYYLIAGSGWVFLDTSLDKAHAYFSTIEKAQLPPPLVAVSNVSKVDEEHTKFDALLKSTGFLGITLYQNCEGLTSSRMLSSAVTEDVFQFENCLDKDNPKNMWVHESWSRNYAMEVNFEGRPVTLMVYQNFTIIERHRVGPFKPTAGMLLGTAKEEALKGFEVIMNSIGVKFRQRGRKAY